ncbi:hypothetical protein [Bacillus sp. AFS017336]|uniref:hypothetical protein n=1 Tax=Bacillus sp. AFS017336 TaxID=2033489 RepID=UPI000BF066C4|nr:hypothetical protein [Bacillus sp. AFS017336]PEL06737.1 hypothetical protein CN601_20640 [Bacillus sp. AFS017336]
MNTKIQGLTDEHKYFTEVKTVIDPETGELLIQAPAATHKMVSVKQAEAFKSRNEAKKGRDKWFTFTDMEAVKSLPNDIKMTHLGYLLYLQCYIDYEGAISVNSRPLNRVELIELLDVSENTFDAFMKVMKNNDIITVSKKVYYVNRAYHYKGKIEDPRVIKSFCTAVKSLYKSAKQADLGFIYKLLPYVHQETNTLCANPYENDMDYTEPLNKSEIAELTGIDEKTLYNKFRRMQVGDHFVFVDISVGTSETFYRINPAIFYRKDGEPDPSLVELFSIKRNAFRKRAKK